MRHGWIVTALSLALALPAVAQQDATMSTPQAPAEIVRERVTFDVAADGSFTKKTEVLSRILTSSGLEFLRQATVSYTEGFETGDIDEAYTLKPNGTRIDVPRNRILYTSGASTRPGFSDIKTKIAVFENVEVGDEVGFTTSLKQRWPWFRGQFFTAFSFPRVVPAHDVQIVLTAPATGLPLQFDVSELQGGQPVTQDGKTTWTWTYENAVPVQPEEQNVSDFDSGPHIVVSSFPDFASVAKAYEDHAKDKVEQTDEIKALAEQQTAGITDRREQAKRLYEWVSSNIKYVAILLGNGGLVPHKASEVLQNRYGDCKDHVVLLESLLAAKGIPSTGALINAGNTFKLSSAASTALFNHIITYVPEFDLFLDSTARYAPFGTLPSADMDKPVLLTGTGVVAHTPTETSAGSTVRTVTSVRIHADGSADGDTTATMTGTISTNFRALMALLPPGSEGDFLRKIVVGATDGSISKGDPQNLTEPYIFSSHYELANAASFPGPGAVSFALGMHPLPMAGLISPNLPVRHKDYACSSLTAIDETILQLPGSVTVTSIPKASDMTAEGVSVHLVYERTGPNTITATRTLKVDHPGVVCTADYYNRIHPELTKMIGLLGAQVLYKEAPEGRGR